MMAQNITANPRVRLVCVLCVVCLVFVFVCFYVCVCVLFVSSIFAERAADAHQTDLNLGKVGK